MNGARRFVNAIDAVNDKVGNVVQYLIPLIVLIVMFEVVARYRFNSPTVWALSTSEFIYCAVIGLGGGYVLLHERHVNVDFITQRLKTRPRAILNICTFPFVIGFVCILLYLTSEATIQSYLFMERASGYWKPFLFPVYTAMFVGILLVLLQGIAELVRNILVAITGEKFASRFREAAK